jgi:two-component system, LytTR family, sensor kinase
LHENKTKLKIVIRNTAILSSLALGGVTALQYLFQLGFHVFDLMIEFVGGVVLGGVNWLYLLVISPFVQSKIGRYLHPYLLLTPFRLGLLVLGSIGVANVLEEAPGIEFGALLDDTAAIGIINEVRGGLFSVVVILVYYLLKILKQRFEAQGEVSRLKAEYSIAQFEMLKQQVNPHFLFNSLNILKTMVRSNDPNSEEFIVRMSDLYRYILTGHQLGKVSMSEELEALENYFFMLRARFGDKLTIYVNLKQREKPCYIPPFTLQILVENCIKHNVVSEQRPLIVEISCENDHIIVRNNLQERKHVEESNGIGLQNIRKRYLMLAGKDIDIIKTETHFLVRLPVIDAV